MIESGIVKIKKIENFDNLYIEYELSKLYKSIVRWSVVDVNENIIVSVSYKN